MWPKNKDKSCVLTCSHQIPVHRVGSSHMGICEYNRTKEENEQLTFRAAARRQKKYFTTCYMDTAEVHKTLLQEWVWS